jgi:hypothetical protein
MSNNRERGIANEGEIPKASQKGSLFLINRRA